MSLLAVGNPFLLQDVLYKVDRALTDAIDAIEGDGGRGASTGPDGQETLLAKFERWREVSARPDVHSSGIVTIMLNGVLSAGARRHPHPVGLVVLAGKFAGERDRDQLPARGRAVCGLEI